MADFKSDYEVMQWLFRQLEQVSSLIDFEEPKFRARLTEWDKNYRKNIQPNYMNYIRTTSRGEKMEEQLREMNASELGKSSKLKSVDEVYVSKTDRLEQARIQFDDYIVATEDTALYPDATQGTPAALMYVALGLAGEVGEIANKIKKIQRGDFENNQQGYDDCIDAIRKEIGDVTWYLARLCAELNLSWGLIAHDNLEKLQDRKKRGVIKGSGDKR